MRFRAGQSSALTSIRYYYLGPNCAGSGYAAGTGGTKRFTIETDDGTTGHWPTGNALATEDLPAEMACDAGKELVFDPAPTLTEGKLYHLVIENTDANPEVNYFSPNYWYYAQPALIDGRWNPKYANTDWAHGMFQSGAWVLRDGYAPILELAYGNGEHEGMGYMELSYNSGEVGIVNGANSMARESITVTGNNRRVIGAGVRLYKISGGTEALTVRLEDSAGVLIDSFTVPAANVPNGTSSYGDEARWVKGTFSQARTLLAGSTYRLRLSTGSATTYKAWPIRRGSHNYGYHAKTVFLDGTAQKTTDGASWSSLGRTSNQNNLQLYFTTQ